jgi:uncharacterized protein (DUF2237 family)
VIDAQILARIQAARERSPSVNVLGGPLEPCCQDPMTGFYRNGRCDTGPEDHGSHVVCVLATEAFLAFSRAAGNDLSTPRPEFDFAGVRPGDRWCLCAARWLEALRAGQAPKVLLRGTHLAALELLRLEDLQAHALDEEPRA